MARTGVDWEIILARSGVANISRFVYASLLLAHKIFGSPLPPPFAWERFGYNTPLAFREWLKTQGVADVLTSDYGRRSRGRDYELTFLAAASARERVGIVQFASLPPLGQLMAKYNLRHRWLAPLFYPRHFAERLGSYGRALLSKS